MLVDTAIGKFAALRAMLERVPLALIQLAMRIAIGMVFLNSGLLKYRSWEFAIKLFEEEYKVPLLNPVVAAWMATAVEVTIPWFSFPSLKRRKCAKRKRSVRPVARCVNAALHIAAARSRSVMISSAR